MLETRIEMGRLRGGQAIVQVPPILRGRICRIDAERLDGVDRLQHTFDFGPAVGGEQQRAPRAQIWQRLDGSSGPCRLHDIEAREDRAIGVGRPTIDPEDRAPREGEAAAVRTKAFFADRITEPDPLLDPAFLPGQFDKG